MQTLQLDRSIDRQLKWKKSKGVLRLTLGNISLPVTEGSRSNDTEERHKPYPVPSARKGRAKIQERRIWTKKKLGVRSALSRSPLDLNFSGKSSFAFLFFFDKCTTFFKQQQTSREQQCRRTYFEDYMKKEVYFCTYWQVVRPYLITFYKEYRVNTPNLPSTSPLSYLQTQRFQLNGRYQWKIPKGYNSRQI